MSSQGLKRVDSSIRKVESYFIAFAIIFITVITFINVSMRYLANTSWTWAEELTRYIMVWMTFIGASLCVRDNVHVTMDVLMEKGPKWLKKPLLYFTYAGSAIISLYLGYLGWKLTMKILPTGQVSSAMEFLPIWFVYLCVPIGGVLMAKNFIHLLILNIKSEETIKTIKEGE